MQRSVGYAFLLVAFVGAWLTLQAAGGERPSRGIRATKSKPQTKRIIEHASAQPLRIAQSSPVLSKKRAVSKAANVGSVAAAGEGTVVYRNVDGHALFYIPGVLQLMADDLTLGSGSCDLTAYTVWVYSQGTSSPSFGLSTAMWDGNPCDPGSSVIAGTEAQFSNLVANVEHRLDADIVPEVTVPGTVWLAATFTTEDAGWLVGDEVSEGEIGFTGDFWAEDDPSFGCQRITFTNPDLYGGFRAEVVCTEILNPPGACCNGIECAEETEIDCTGAGGTWYGAFTDCSPNPCLPGACCSGQDLATCAETTEAGCIGGTKVFHAGATCDQTPCDPAFKVFENDFDTGQFDVVEADTMWADDLHLGLGAPCELAAYNLTVAGEGGGPFDLHVELWSNDDRGTIFNETDDLPLAPITGTAADFSDIPSDLTRHTLIADHFDGIGLPKQVWMVLSPSSDLAGPVLGGVPDIGFSRDAFAIFNHPDAPGVWADNFWLGGFDPEGCPDPDSACNPAGSFHINVWCKGLRPTGACCSDAAGTCIDNVTQAQCDGRWTASATCDESPFAPRCGASACCWLSNCSHDTDPVTCEGIGGDVARGALCSQIQCPREECVGAQGDCHSANGTPGCDDAFCCEKVCAQDPSCCAEAGLWDEACAEDALELCPPPLMNDHCAEAEVISGEAEFPFDNSQATTDGPPHVECGEGDEGQQIFDDVWYCWTATCTSTVYVSTCQQPVTDDHRVDTKIAVYEGCDLCPPSGNELLGCNDDFCGLKEVPQRPADQSQVSFDASAGESYLIRVGTPFQPDAGAEPGPGTFTITCGLPRNPACPGAADCCAAAGSPGCVDELCCETVCACDPFCCEVTWDENCAGTGVDGCGAELLCPALCGDPCPDGAVTFIDPPDGIVDARQPHEPANAAVKQGIDVITVEAPPGADNLRCWSLCETVVDANPNDVAAVVDNLDGTFIVALLRPISAGGLTAITYSGDGGTSSTGTYVAHPANVNADGASNADDLVTMVDCCLNQQCQPGATTEETPYRCDVNRSGKVTPADMLRAIDLLNGGDQLSVWRDTVLPTGNGNCP